MPRDDIGRGLASFAKGYATGIRKRGLLRPRRWTPTTKEEWEKAERFKAGVREEAVMAKEERAAFRKTRKQPTYNEAIRQFRAGQRTREDVTRLFPRKDVEKDLFEIDVRG
ncbi:unnamed protein product, partial [marine sediment metagenome]